MLQQEMRRGKLIALKASGSGSVGFRFFKEKSMNYWVWQFFFVLLIEGKYYTRHFVHIIILKERYIQPQNKCLSFGLPSPVS